MSGFVSRGFRRRRDVPDDAEHRLLPGQYAESGFPVLTAGPTPRIDPADYRFGIEGLVRNPSEWSLDELKALPGSTFDGDIHCVTKWSKLGTSFGGVSLDVLFDLVQPLDQASHVLAFSYGGYTTNIPLADLRGGLAWVAWEHEGAPLPPEHGGPARLLIPHLYFWKSAKWVKTLRLLDHDQTGFWEMLGYRNHGDPWLEQRYAGD